MKATEARTVTDINVDEKIKEIYKVIKSSAINGEAVAFVEHNKLTEEMIKRLTTEGYTVDTYGSESYSIQW